MAYKRNHYVPEFYLKSFALSIPGGRKPMIWVYNKDGGSARQQSPKDTAVISDLYTIRNVEGVLPNFLEQEFAKCESTVKPILERWVEPGAKPAVKEIFVVSEFLAYLYLRVPRTIDAIKQISVNSSIINIENLARNPERLSKAFEWLRSNKQPNLTIEELRDLVGNVERRFEIRVNDTFALATTLRMFETVEKRLREFYWCLSTAPPSSEFISCDSPLVIVFREGNKMGLGGGFGHPNAEVSFPLSPKVCLTLDRRTNLKRKILGDSGVLELNRRAAAVAERYIFSAQKTQYVHKLVEAFAVTRKMPKVSRNALRAHLESKSGLIKGQGRE
jgi:hypothetical protein